MLLYKLSSVWWLFIVLLLGYVYYKWIQPWVRAVRFVSSLPGPKATPIFGSLFSRPDILELFCTGYQKYGPIFRDWLFFFPCVVVLEPKHLQLILGSNKHTDKHFLYSIMNNFIGQGLITSNGDKWKLHRKYIQPYFTLNNFKEVIPAFTEGSNLLVEDLKNLSEVKITSAINKCVFDTLHQVVLGIPFEDQEFKNISPFNQGDKTFMDRLREPLKLLDFTYAFTSDFNKHVQQTQTLKQFINRALEMRALMKKKDKFSNWCILDVLYEISENNPDFTENDIVDEASTFMLAGQDSVSSAVSYSLYYLAKYQDIQAMVIKELDEIFEQNPVITMTSLNNMKYLEQCIKESMRISPSVPLLARSVSEDVNLGTHVIPAGTLVLILPIGTHRLPHYYPDPEKFDPERFSSENQEGINPFAYIPFSAGPRNCLGYKLAMFQMKTVISTLLKNYQFYLIPGKEDLRTTYRMTLKAKGGIPLGLKPRTKKI